MPRQIFKHEEQEYYILIQVTGKLFPGIHQIIEKLPAPSIIKPMTRKPQISPCPIFIRHSDFSAGSGLTPHVDRLHVNQATVEAEGSNRALQCPMHHQQGTDSLTPPSTT